MNPVWPTLEMNGNFGFQSIIPDCLKISKELPEVIHVSIDKK